MKYKKTSSNVENYGLMDGPADLDIETIEKMPIEQIRRELARMGIMHLRVPEISALRKARRGNVLFGLLGWASAALASWKSKNILPHHLIFIRGFTVLFLMVLTAFFSSLNSILVTEDTTPFDKAAPDTDRRAKDELAAHVRQLSLTEYQSRGAVAGATKINSHKDEAKERSTGGRKRFKASSVHTYLKGVRTSPSSDYETILMMHVTQSDNLQKVRKESDFETLGDVAAMIRREN